MAGSRNSHAPGLQARAVCDRCGFVYNYSDLSYETQNRTLTHRRVCPTCLDPDHPQVWGVFELPPLDDPRPLRDPRPPRDAILAASYFGWRPVGDHNSDGIQNTMRVRISVGNVTVVT